MLNEKRRNALRFIFVKRDARLADKYRKTLIKWYGKEKGEAVQHAEAFEICEYGRKISDKEVYFLFQFD